jgi:excisionase family DNA binding protein
MKILTSRELAKLLRVSEDTILRMRQRGELPFHRLGRRIVFNLDEVMEATKEREGS